MDSFDPELVPVRSAHFIGGRYVDSTIRLWPGLLALALVLNLVELTMRKWRGILESLRGNRSVARRSMV